MRIISGKFKGKNISYLKSTITRPLKDSVKENIFNIIIHSNLLNIKFENSYILDLFSGVGSFGLECISRGAKKTCFVEKDNDAIEILNKNLTSLAIQNKAIIFTNKIEDFLEIKQPNKFRIIFLDPPFADISFIKELELIRKKRIYEDKHIVIIHRETQSHDNFEHILNILIVKEYGRSKIIFGQFLS